MTSESNSSPFRFHDCYDLVAEWIQSLGSAKKSEATEEVLGLETKKQRDAYIASHMEKLKSFWKGTNNRLQVYNYVNFVVLNKRDNTMRHQYWYGVWNMKAPLEQYFNNLRNSWLKNTYADPAYFISLREGGPLYCSEGDLKS